MKLTLKPVVVSVVGADGTVLLSSMPHANDNFSGVLPSSQDYFLKVTGGSSIPIIFRLTVLTLR